MGFKEKIVERKKLDDEFRQFIEDNREQILAKSVRPEDLPQDDEWILDDIWDKIYEEVVISGKAI